MPKPISSYMFLCRELIRDKNDIYSAIKIADVFLIDRPVGDKPIVTVTHGYMVAHLASPVGTEHHVRITLHYPSGRVEEVMPLDKVVIIERIPGVLGGLTIECQMTLLPEEMGTHFFKLEVDGEVCSVSPFTFAYKQGTTPE